MVPITTSTTRKGTSADSVAATSWVAPMAAASSASWRSRSRPARRVATRAPVRAPTASVELSRAYPPAPLRNTWSVYAVRTVAMLTPVIATKPMRITGHSTVGVRRTYARPSRSCPFARGTDGVGVSSSTRITLSKTTATRHATALTTKAQPSPTAWISTPATAGPTSAPPWNTAEFRLIACPRFVGPATSLTNAWRAGASNAVARPVSSAAPRMCHACARPERAAMPTRSVETPNTACVIIRMLRRGNRSATTPPRRLSATMGANWNATVSPTIAVDPVSVSISQSWATRAAQLAVLVRICPPT